MRRATHKWPASYFFSPLRILAPRIRSHSSAHHPCIAPFNRYVSSGLSNDNAGKHYGE